MNLNLKKTVLNELVTKYEERVEALHHVIHEKTGEGSDFLGWLDYAETLSEEEIKAIEEKAKEVQQADLLVVSGIGGSYLGAKCLYEALRKPFGQKPEVIFTGNSLSTKDTLALLKYLEGKDVYVNVISKSGTTLETALNFRLLRDYMKKTYKDFSKRIIATTDREKGALRTLATKEEYTTFVIPDDIGGRFSVMTPVGLFPLAAAGIDIRSFLQGMKDAIRFYSTKSLKENTAYQYAALRNMYYENGKKVELFVSFEPRLSFFSEWFKQLFGESEGKDHRGIFPASAIYSTDLHSLGQYVQDGERMLFETFFNVKEEEEDLLIQEDPLNLDMLNYLSNKTLQDVCQSAMIGTSIAHREGGVEIIELEMERLDAYSLGEAMYFFMKACAMSAYLLGVNPFNQPGVEDYKKNMFALLGKPGTEERKAVLLERMKEV
ncbi:glucose-6-phosphate isomerase [Guggenheimella bovis]